MVPLYLLDKAETQGSREAVPAPLALGYSSLTAASNAKLPIRNKGFRAPGFLFGAAESRVFYCLNRKDGLPYKL